MEFLALNDIVAALSMLADVIGEGLVAISLGWAARPTGIGFIIGFVLLLGFRSVAPVSFEVESLTIVSRIAKKQWHIMLYAVMLAGIIGAILGAMGAYSIIVELHWSSYTIWHDDWSWDYSFNSRN